MPSDYTAPKEAEQGTRGARITRELTAARQQYERCKEKFEDISRRIEDGKTKAKGRTPIKDEMVERAVTEALTAYRDATTRYGRVLGKYHKFKARREVLSQPHPNRSSGF